MTKNLDAPEDKYNFVYFVFYWLGIGTLLPWNFFISVSEYWMFKYETKEETISVHVDDEISDANATSPSGLNPLQMQWNSNLAVASMVPNVTFLLLNAVFGHRFKTQPRLIVSLLLVILLFIFTCIMAKIDTDSWQNTFQLVTLISVVLINTNAAIFQGGLLGISGKFPPNYIGSVFSGQALGGIFASATNVVMISLELSPPDTAFYCFLIACVFLASALVAYIYVTRSEFFKFYNGDLPKKMVEIPAEEDGKLVVEESSPAPPSIPTKVNPISIMKQIWVYALAVFLIFVVTLGCFPALTVLVQSTSPGNRWSDKYFIPVICFLGFNVGDYIGRILAEKFQFPKPGTRGAISVLIATILRFAFVPLFLMCNASPMNRVMTSVVFQSDSIYIVLMLLFSVSNGYLASICMISGPQLCLKPEEQSTAASLMVATLGFGLGGGALISKAFVELL